jgi:ABC-2 type transport system ATP-binding protein
MIELASVTRYFGELRAVDDLSFSLSKGEILGLLGPNGAGKTTTMRMITGFLRPSAGTIRVDGMDVTAEPAEVKNRIGYLPEMAPFYGEMMVWDYLLYAARMHGLEDRDRIAEVAAMCSIGDVMHKNIETLSRGYKQRVGLAFSLIHDPDILILDEPTSGLDPNQITEVRRLIREIGRSKTVIISTHILPEVEGLCDRVMIINRGHLAADSPTEELTARFGRRVTVRVQAGGCGADELIAVLSGIDGVDEVLPDGTGEPELAAVLVSSSGVSDLRPALFHAVADRGWELYELSQTKNSLEEIFRGLTVEGAEGGAA